MSDSDDFVDEDDVTLSSRASRSAKRKGIGDEDDDEYRIRGALKPYRTTSYTTQALYEQIVSNDIDLSPDYQPEVVWPESKQIGLIDSILRNFYVPPLIFAVVYREDSSERRVCIDGKQHLTSIFRFLNGEIYYNDSFTGERLVYKDIGKFKSIRLLPERYQKIFRNKQTVCIEYQDLTNDCEREIFQRVQLGMALTPAEKLQATKSPMATFVRDLQNDYVAEGLAVLLPWDTHRGSDFRCITSSVILMDNLASANNAIPFPTLQKVLSRPDEPDSKFQDQVHQTYQIFLMLARDDAYSAAFRIPDVKKLAPVEFIATVALIHNHKYKMMLAQLAEAIKGMRQDIRAREVDIRLNQRVLNAMIDFIRDLKPSDMKPDPKHLAAAKLRPLKRKRNEEDGEDGEVPDRKKRVESYTSVVTASQAHSMAPPSALPKLQTKTERPASPAMPRPPAATPPPLPSSAFDRLASIRLAKESALPERASTIVTQLSRPSHGIQPTMPQPNSTPLPRHSSMDYREPKPSSPIAPTDFPPPRGKHLKESLMARMTALPLNGDEAVRHQHPSIRRPYPPRPPHGDYDYKEPKRHRAYDNGR
ncbi:uncharacterized protein LAESUDRAFT_816905 [Laetiporus sulphureus 93-53]|uniref:GmrSD restriction endonucleases N-terminal domain-containing protein n=1 Tax=Laetiporus sulphureus 93-53 TaxID=1314785 RepID=A0A165ASM8_9APHY|nr:uncharacterized protein LAESUDRAFT_816905 [Laetiporus sulphureus 93-53]KZS99585.1 hypothetical protein LAESUDRAFT_816905 [Laetiporus sulphureus 93-53]